MTRRIPTLSLLVPTHREDRPLRRCLDSAKPQLRRGDEVIVIGDTRDRPLPGVEALVKSYGRQFRYVAHDAGHHCYGHCQLDHALPLAQGDYIHCNDDDDAWTPDALATFRKLAGALPEPLPFLFRFQSYHGPIYWQRLGLFARNHIGGHCLLAPNIPAKLGRFGCDYNGDFDMVESTVNAYGGPDAAIWREEVIAWARPI